MSSASTSAQATGLPPGIKPGGLGKRFVAYLIDGSVPFLVGVALALVQQLLSVDFTVVLVLSIAAAIVVIGWAVILWWMLATRGATLGLQAMKLQVVGLSNGRPIGWGRAFLRQLVLVALGYTVIGLIAMLIMMLMHPRKQGWHDLAAKSVVIVRRVQRSRPSEPGVESRRRQSAPSSSPVGLPAHLTGGQADGSAPQQPAPAARGDSSAGGPPWLDEPSQTPQQGFGQQQGVGQQQGFGQQQGGGQQQGFGHQQSPPGQYQAQQPAARDERAYQRPASAPSAAERTEEQSAFPGAGFPGGPPPASGSSAPEESTRLVPRVGGVTQRAPNQGWIVSLDDGRQVTVESLVLIGRNPQPRAGEEGAELVQVGDNSRTLSKTHLAVGVDNRGVYVMDRGSTNGSALASGNGQYEPCAPGDTVRVREGQIVSFGEHRLEIKRSYT
ncbi:MAG: RDD family protein [Propionibacteriaceae bacterium]